VTEAFTELRRRSCGRCSRRTSARDRGVRRFTMAYDEWVINESYTIDSRIFAELHRLLEDVCPVIVEHRFYMGARSPERLVFDDYERLEDYLGSQTRPGDHVLFWRYDECCTDSNITMAGKMPDAEGRTPVGGAY
jgi:hypothetical protein